MGIMHMGMWMILRAVKIHNYLHAPNILSQCYLNGLY